MKKTTDEEKFRANYIFDDATVGTEAFAPGAPVSNLLFLVAINRPISCSIKN